ncbi:hypothetical protein, partial [Intestinimonas sp. HCP28S3_D6]|uniref:hypothetical protein n=1 Tax=Intestinimonas sp. HCP28S3_D6 TaxID=3438942 RepID=UPI003F8A7766
IHEHEALGGGSGRRLYCRLTSFSRSLQIILRINLDGTLKCEKFLTRPNLTSTRFVFFIHAKSSLYNRLLDIAKTAFQKKLTSKSTVF